jgi:hypothetical protein
MHLKKQRITEGNDNNLIFDLWTLYPNLTGNQFYIESAIKRTGYDL